MSDINTSPIPVFSVVKVRSAVNPCIFLPFLPTVKLALSKFAALSNMCISSPTAGLLGKVIVNAAVVAVSANSLSPATAVYAEVFTVHLFNAPLIASVVVIVSTNVSLNLKEVVPKSTSESVSGANTPSAKVACTVPAHLRLNLSAL